MTVESRPLSYQCLDEIVSHLRLVGNPIVNEFFRACSATVRDAVFPLTFRTQRGSQHTVASLTFRFPGGAS